MPHQVPTPASDTTATSATANTALPTSVRSVVHSRVDASATPSSVQNVSKRTTSRIRASPSSDPSGANSAPSVSGLIRRPAAIRIRPSVRGDPSAPRDPLGVSADISADLRDLWHCRLRDHSVDRDRRPDLLPHDRLDDVDRLEARIGLDVAIELRALGMIVLRALACVSLLVERADDDVVEPGSDVVVELLDLEAVDGRVQVVGWTTDSPRRLAIDRQHHRRQRQLALLEVRHAARQRRLVAVERDTLDEPEAHAVHQNLRA